MLRNLRTLALGIATLLICGILAPTDSRAASVCTQDNLNILFLGNSLTYVNNLPNVLTQISAVEGKTVTTTMYANGGWTLAQHDIDATANALIAGGGWDYVVLQEQSQTAVIFPGNFHAAVNSLDAKIKAAGAKTLLYHNWALNTQPTWFPQYQFQFGTAASNICGDWAPAGDAWWDLQQNDNATWLSLYSDDRHPTARGTYLTACVFFSVLFGAPVTQPDPVMGLNAGDAAYMANTAWNAVTPWQSVATVKSKDTDSYETGLDPAEFYIEVTIPDTICEIDFFYCVGGTAINGVDYQLLGGSAGMPINATTTAITLIPIADMLVEGTETIEITLHGGPWYRVNPAMITINLHDDTPADTPTFTPTFTPTVTVSNTFTSTFTSSFTPSQTPIFSATPSTTPSQTTTPTPTHSPAMPSTFSPTQTLTVNPSLDLPLVLLQAMAAPNPMTAAGAMISFELQGRADEVSLKIYTPAMMAVIESTQTGSYDGWSQVAIPAGFFDIAANGIYWAQITVAQHNSDAIEPFLLKFLYLK